MHKLISVAVLGLLASTGAAQSSTDLTGLWEATLRWGPDVRGPLLIYQTPQGWVADIAGYKAPARLTPGRRPGEAGSFAFTLPGGKGELRDGFWISELNFATPVRLTAAGPNRWRAEIDPVDDRAEVFLPITRQPDGTLRTYIRELRRNFGFFLRAKRIEVNGADVRLIGSISARGPDTLVLSRGRYEDGTMSLPMRGVTFDFTRVTDTANSPFYPLGHPPARYHYTPPVQLDDGWPVGTLEEVGISRDSIERFVQSLIDMKMDSLSTLQIHSLLIARHGKLVLEEYFHGNHRDLPHDTRSASKSWIAVLIGAAMQTGIPLRTGTPVYQTMLGTVPPDVEPRKRAMTLEHLLTMTAGFNCDPDDSTSADEDQMNDRGIQGWYRYTMNVPLVSAPGEKIFYCSTEPNLAAGMLAKVAGEPDIVLFDRLVAQPLQLNNYHLGLRDGDLYGGGGSRFTTRDFAKMAQLMLNEGQWGGRQILSRDWVRQSGAALRDLGTTQQYGFLWNSIEYDYRGRKVRAVFAGGNGGQVSMAIPDLDLVIAFTGGNYGTRGLNAQLLLPAVQ